VSEVVSVRRSPVYRRTNSTTSRLVELNGFMVPLAISEDHLEVAAAGQLALFDASWLPRIGFKGKDTITWLTTKGLEIPERPNMLSKIDRGSLIIRLGATECLILADPNRFEESSFELVQGLEEGHAETAGMETYILPRQDSHCCFVLFGEVVPQLFSKICAVDFSAGEFPNHAVAQTIVARLGAIVIRIDSANAMAYLILADSSSAEYLWDCLVDAMDEYSGGLVGLNAVRYS